MSASIDDRVRDVAANLFNISADELTVDSSPATVAGWDSLQQLNLVLALEQEFDLQLRPEDIEQMQNIGRIVDLITTKLLRVQHLTAVGN